MLVVGESPLVGVESTDDDAGCTEEANIMNGQRVRGPRQSGVITTPPLSLALSARCGVCWAEAAIMLKSLIWRCLECNWPLAGQSLQKPKIVVIQVDPNVTIQCV